MQYKFLFRSWSFLEFKWSTVELDPISSDNVQVKSEFIVSLLKCSGKMEKEMTAPRMKLILV